MELDEREDQARKRDTNSRPAFLHWGLKPQPCHRASQPTACGRFEASEWLTCPSMDETSTQKGLATRLVRGPTIWSHSHHTSSLRNCIIATRGYDFP